MWHPDKSKLLKVRLQARGEDVETPWAEDLGPTHGRRGRVAPGASWSPGCITGDDRAPAVTLDEGLQRTIDWCRRSGWASEGLNAANSLLPSPRRAR